MKILLESPVYTVEAALDAARFGVDRLELCSSFPEGGETPGPGLLRYLKKNIDIPVFVMIRPRGGGFVYSPDEIEVMAEEIRIFSSLGADGFVFGILNPDGSVHAAACKRLIEAADENPCTFHRAFDVSRNPEESLETIIDCGFARILTSGSKNSVEEGLPHIIRLMELAEDRIIMMPGGGLKPELVQPLKETGFLKEIHASCKTIRPAAGTFNNPDVQLRVRAVLDGVLGIDPAIVRIFKQILQ